MSVSEGEDLAAEVLEFLNTNWETDNFEPEPLLHHDDEKLVYPGGDSRAKDIDLRNHDVIGAAFVERRFTPIGTEYDHEVEADVELTVEAVLRGGSSGGGVDRAHDFRQLVDEAKRAILEERTYPLTNLDSRYTYHSLEITNGVDEPIEVDNRDYYNYQFTVRFKGYEELP